MAILLNKPKAHKPTFDHAAGQEGKLGNDAAQESDCAEESPDPATVPADQVSSPASDLSSPLPTEPLAGSSVASPPKSIEVHDLVEGASESVFMSVPEFAELLGTCSKTVTRWIEDGKLEAYKPGRHWKIPKKSVIALLTCHASGAKTQTVIECPLKSL